MHRRPSLEESFMMHGIEYHKCCNAASLWVNEVVKNKFFESSDEDKVVEASFDFYGSQSSNINVSIASLNNPDDSDTSD
jgi:hypothetical protein